MSPTLFRSSAAAAGPRKTIPACGSSIDVQFEGDTQIVSRDDLTNWIRRAATAVCTYYGKYPVPHLKLDVHVRGGPGVHHGVTYPDEGGFITISVGAQTTVADLNDDWMLTHEMIHLALPSIKGNHHWIEEGISVYVEPIARVQAAQLSVVEMWKETVRDMPQGEPQEGDHGLDGTHTWGALIGAERCFAWRPTFVFANKPTIAMACKTLCAEF